MPDDYLDFRPIGQRQGRLHVAEPVNVSSTASRRPHVRAYREYMCPSLASTLDNRWEVTSGVVCGTHAAKGIIKIQAPLFEFLVDREFWESYFIDIQTEAMHESLVKTPRWPFSATQQMMQHKHPSSRQCAEYLENVKR
ncbi:hypothetical protein FBULB1_5888 [Fusarium bulbicola]|nr:hypothetical protein FBULB1_5888 [Fusarium bulbicola]